MLLVGLFCVLLPSAAAFGEMDEQKYQNALAAVSDAYRKVDKSLKVASTVKSFNDALSKFSTDAAALPSDTDSAAAHAAKKLKTSLKSLDASLNDVIVAASPKTLEDVIKENFKFIIGNCFTTEQALKSSLTIAEYNCKDGGKLLKKCVTGGSSPKPELVKVWTYYETEGIRKTPNGLCLNTEEQAKGRGGVFFFTKTLQQWGDADTPDQLAGNLFRQMG